MKTITIEEAAKAAEGHLIRRGERDTVSGVVHDSRECGESDLFVGVKGARTDGHRFLPQAVKQGCGSVLISDESALADDMHINAILVEDTVKAMGKLAAWYLDQLDLIRVAVTGSVGKTSTRDLIYYVLNEKFRCGRNLKNYNNEIGLPLSIFQLEEDHRAVVLEIGMSDFGEIDYLAGIVRPHIGVITNIGNSHMETLGSQEGIFQAKMELAAHVPSREEGGTMVFAHDSEFLTRERTAGDYESIFVGSDGHSDYIVTDIEDRGIEGIRFAVEYEGERVIFSVPLPGRHNAVNATLAGAVGHHLGMTPDEIQKGLSRATLTGNRLKVRRKGTLTVIDDTYNASPASMKSALRVLEKSSCVGKRTAILGEMYELGSDEARMHYHVGVFAAGCGIDRIIAVGPLARHIAEGAEAGCMEAFWFADKEDFLKHKEEYIAPDDVVLVKASRGMKMEAIVDALTMEDEKE